MPRKAANKSAPQSEDAFFTALFDLIEEKGWWELSLPQIARALKTPLPILLKTYPDKNALLTGFLHFIDRQIAGEEIEGADSLKERLFEILMRRFEAMQPYRGGLVRLLDEIMANPVSGVCLGIEMAPSAGRAARLMLDLAGFPKRKPLNDLGIGGLKLVYLSTLRAWKNDFSSDLSATMAALDRALMRFLSILRLPA